MSIQGLWAGPCLSDAAGLARPEVARALLLTAAGMTSGFVLVGAAAARLSRVGIRPMTVAVGGMTVFIGVLCTLLLGIGPLHVPLWVLFGFFGTSGVLTYAALSQQFPIEVVGRLNTALNLLVFVAAFAAQWGIGAVIGRWPSLPGGGYPAAAYRAAFLMMVILQVGGVIWYHAAGSGRIRKTAGGKVREEDR